jgi:uncharacterized protein (DUF2235 family)
MKRIIICFDGTWDHPEENPVSNTNVLKMYNAVDKKDSNGIKQIKWYDPGVGTNWYDKIPGGIAGVGLSENIKQGYRNLAKLYEEGDEVFVWGFSRGAYTARSLVGLIRNCGLIKKNYANSDNVNYAYSIYRTRDESADTSQAIMFREKYSRMIEIKFLGVWDTVGALGIPFKSFGFFNRAFYEFHDVELSSIVKNAFHAVAIDEHREIFNVTLWDPKTKPNQRMEQVWFVGSHADVGGGYTTQGGIQLSTITLEWIMNKAESCGLQFTGIPKAQSLLNCTVIPITNSRIGIYGLEKSINRGIGFTLYGNEAIHSSVNDLIRSPASYRPENDVSKSLKYQFATVEELN